MGEKVEVKELSKKTKIKSHEEIDSENSKLLAAFSGSSEEAGDKLDPSVLAGLKAKMSKPQDVESNDMPEIINEQEVSINLSVIGVGQAGSRIAEEFHKLGYDVGVINTSAQDLKFINVLPAQKLLLEGSLGGTGKDLDLGREIFEDNRQETETFVNGVSEGNDMVFLAVSGGGGTGASCIDVMVPMLYNMGMPVGVIYILPKTTEDPKSKDNTIETLAGLARMTADDMISSLVVVDNARIEQIYGGLSQTQFWKTANAAIVEPIHLFNSLTAQASEFTSLDPSDFGKIISCGDCSIYGVVEVDDYMEEVALAEAVISSLGDSMLASGFDLTQTRVAGILITGSREALDRLPAINIDYCFHVLSDQTNGASIFQGIYEKEDVGDKIKIYSWFAGLGLPQDRIDSLRKESKEQKVITLEKQKQRGSVMTLNLEEDKVGNLTEQIHKKIEKKKSGFNRLQGGARRSIIDKRRR